MHQKMYIMPLNTVSRSNSKTLKYHDFTKKTNRNGFNLTLQENKKKNPVFMMGFVSRKIEIKTIKIDCQFTVSYICVT